MKIDEFVNCLKHGGIELVAIKSGIRCYSFKDLQIEAKLYDDDTIEFLIMFSETKDPKNEDYFFESIDNTKLSNIPFWLNFEKLIEKVSDREGKLSFMKFDKFYDEQMGV